ncbi:hypothetical protein NPIL_536661 [Nephila pilipes]|uniref:Uncharacterized protein n=1 Tax=Nephila pilipes TaxID=299642 RepID=A0A8X6U1I6_NEPPI|nr:hypothetical protein NPIL_536661 [Nephila pilipes]
MIIFDLVTDEEEGECQISISDFGKIQTIPLKLLDMKIDGRCYVDVPAICSILRKLKSAEELYLKEKKNSEQQTAVKKPDKMSSVNGK